MATEPTPREVIMSAIPKVISDGGYLAGLPRERITEDIITALHAAGYSVQRIHAGEDEDDVEHSCRWCPHAKTGEGLG